MTNSYACIWCLTDFCRFYGRVIPVNERDGVFTKFHTYTRNEDIDDLYVSFNEELEPLSFMQIVAMSRSLYVIGHGEPWSEWGRTFYPKYTLFTKEQISSLCDKSIFFRGGTVEDLFSSGQAIIFNYEDYLKKIPIAEDKEEIKDLPFDEPSSPDLPF